jgi:hypothetical protein
MLLASHISSALSSWLVSQVPVVLGKCVFLRNTRSVTIEERTFLPLAPVDAILGHQRLKALDLFVGLIEEASAHHVVHTPTIAPLVRLVKRELQDSLQPR